ncbi:adenylate kinase [Hyphomicrobium sulfonivorans]|uniref:adenylate kinase n=1 Tax=Hyphomicrobium sulfonivorans TaxID=121290 RepID=UPI0015701AE8|nr:adenylate kinase [Hyphomicrobium sulfonivorans]MBI1650523.1 adenylate kinase [Hyphomicrobium sulfonivorans]NSL72119.1 adenylate kinase [Hyphomicrobium sulfonivorans]
MQRILVIGSPGAGKSTASRRVARMLDLPLVHLDRHYWQADWEPTSPEQWREKVRQLVAAPRWVIDGNYTSTLDLRLASADTVIYLDFSTALCLTRVLRRTLRNLGRERPDELPPGCPERLDPAFLRYVIRFRRDVRMKIIDHLAGFSGRTYRFASPGELERFLTALQRENRPAR